MTLQDLLEKARASAQKLQASEAAVLFAAAVRLAATRGATLRARLIEIDEAGVLHLLPFDENAPEPTPSYLAPEARGAGGPRKTEPRVQVYAAGALGYELLTGRPAPPGAPGNELSGALGDIVRIALAADRRERFGDLNQLQDALAGVQPRPPAEGERNILLALRSRYARPPPEKEAVARLIEKVAALEQQVGKVQARTESLREGFERFEEGERRRAERKPSSSALPGFVAGVIGAALVLAIAWLTGFAGRGGSATADARVADAGTRTAAIPSEETSLDDGRDAAVSRAGGSRAALAGAARQGGAGGAAAAGAAGSRTADARPRAPQRGTDAGGEAAAAQSSGVDASTAEDSSDDATEASDDAADASQANAGAAQPPADTSSQASASDASTPTGTPTASDSSATADPADGGAASGSGIGAAPSGSAMAASSQPASAAQPATPPPPHRRSSARGAKQTGVSPSAINHAFALSQVRRGESALEHGHADDAVSSFRSALDNEPGIAVAYRGLGMAYAVQGNDAEALRAYQKYLQLMPGAKDAKDIRRSMAEIKDRGKLGEEK